MSDNEIDLSQYPSKPSEYVGQKRAVQMLMLAAKSARMRNEPMEHALISHAQPGIGKTALALLAGREMRTRVKIVNGVVHRDKARLLFADMQDRDVLFWDEIHQCVEGGARKAGWMLTYLNDGYIMGPLGPEVQPRVTVIGATTKSHKIPADILSRFLLRPPMTDYTEAEASKIATAIGKRVLLGPNRDPLPALTGKAAHMLAYAANGNPRAMKKLLTVLRDLVVTGTISSYDIDALLDFQGITHDGLDLDAQSYLTTLANEFGGTAGARTIADRLMLDDRLSEVERVLQVRGYIAKTSSGRTLTQSGIRRYTELEAA